MAQSHFSLTGAATAIGEQPLKGLINPAAMARLCLGEALTNLVWAQSTGLADIKASVNWMYAAKMASEGVAMYEAATALKEAMVELQVLALITVFLVSAGCQDQVLACQVTFGRPSHDTLLDQLSPSPLLYSNTLHPEAQCVIASACSTCHVMDVRTHPFRQSVVWFMLSQNQM